MSNLTNYTRDCRTLLERGMKSLEEAEEHEKRGEYKAAEEKRKQGEEDILAVRESVLTRLGIQKKGLELDIADLENSLKNGISERGKQILKSIGYNIKF